MSRLTTLANNAGTDKGTQCGAAHGYSLVYEMLLAPFRDRENVRILELGLAIGGPELDGRVDRVVECSPSVDAWRSYFDHATIVGFDISEFSHVDQDRFTFVRGDSGRRQDLEKLLDLGPFDVIVDDASHASYHQQLALAVLFGALKPGGLYIVEDLSWQPETMENKLPTVPRTAAVISTMLATGSCPTTAAISADEAKLIEHGTSGVMMFEESYLNALGDSYNRRHGLPRVDRLGWRGRSKLRRVIDPHFWLFSMRRFAQGIDDGAGGNWQSTKLAILQATTDP